MLTDVQCKKATCPPDKEQVRLPDAGSLYLLVGLNGSKRWMWKYRFDKKEKLMALGSYPDVSLRDARNARDAARQLKATGVDPMAARKLEKLRGSARLPFEEVRTLSHINAKARAAGPDAIFSQRIREGLPDPRPALP